MEAVIGHCGSDLCGILGCYPFTFNNVYLLQWPWAEGIVMYSPGICIEVQYFYSTFFCISTYYLIFPDFGKITPEKGHIYQYFVNYPSPFIDFPDFSTSFINFRNFGHPSRLFEIVEY